MEICEQKMHVWGWSFITLDFEMELLLQIYTTVITVTAINYFTNCF